jgi:hypothetical protein
MSVDRVFWKSISISRRGSTPLPCPICRGVLHLVKESLQFESSANATRNESHPDWEHAFWTGCCSAIFKCSTERCSETVPMCGLATVTEYDQGEYEPECERPLYFHPPLPLFPISENCPTAVAMEINAGFALFWTDHAGLMSHFRKAVEVIMDKLKVRKTTVVTDKLGKRHYKNVALHLRIDMYRKKHPELGEQLEALKWLGNVGSHSDKIDQEDVFDACDILENFIQEHFEKRGNLIRKMAKSINKAKKPRSHRRLKKKNDAE